MIPPKSMTPSQARHWPDAQLSAGLYDLEFVNGAGQTRIRRAASVFSV